MDLSRLRAETRPEHEATEAQMPLMSPDLTRATYAAVLACLYPLLAGWEEWALANAPASAAALMTKRRRAALLAEDLTCLHEPIPAPAIFPADHIPGIATEAGFFGAMYVVEGSTLGGQYIARHVEPLLGLRADCGTAYFRGYGDQTSVHWKEFQSALAALPDDSADEVIAAARAMFRVFGEALAPGSLR